LIGICVCHMFLPFLFGWHFLSPSCPSGKLWLFIPFVSWYHFVTHRNHLYGSHYTQVGQCWQLT
jgi:hypothetical protein